jgi:hypothetical protein
VNHVIVGPTPDSESNVPAISRYLQRNWPDTVPISSYHTSCPGAAGIHDSILPFIFR